MKVMAIHKGQYNGRLWDPDKGDVGPFDIPDEPAHKKGNEDRGFIKGMPLAFSPRWMEEYVSPKKEEVEEEVSSEKVEDKK